MTPSKQLRVGFIGGGNMAEALLRGLLQAGTKPQSIVVGEPLGKRRAQLRRRYGIVGTKSNLDVVRVSKVLVLAVKPQVLREALTAMASAVDSDHLVVSIAAGVRLATIEQALGERCRVVRVMPNTPCLVSRGMSVLCRGSHASAADLRTAKQLFATVGAVEIVNDEADLDAVTGLSGSGPAYVYYFVEALIEGGVSAGLDRELARTLAYETVAGAAEMLCQTGGDPAELRAAVSSPGGTTLAGLDRLDRGKFVATVGAAVAAATARSKELASAK